MAILVLSATSEIAAANARMFVRRGENVLLAARRVEALDVPEGAVTLHYDARVDIKDFHAAEAFWTRVGTLAQQRFGEPIHALYVAQGFLPSGNRECWPDELEPTLFLNFTSVATLLEVVARQFESAGRSAPGKRRWIAVLASVAGDRGRPSNYPYGAAKAGIEAYLSGVRARLSAVDVSVLTVKPGLVRTKMIAGRPQECSATVASPERVARSIDAAIRRRAAVLYTPWFWAVIMFFVRRIPESIFKRLRS